MNDYKTKKALVVDDDADMLFQTAEMLSGVGFEVDTADGEISAMEKIKEKNYDLAVLDLMMENMDSGFILSHRIKSSCEKTKVIIMSAVTKDTGFTFGSDTKEEYSWIKADSFINKDMRFEQLLAEVTRIMA